MYSELRKVISTMITQSQFNTPSELLLAHLVLLLTDEKEELSVENKPFLQDEKRPK